MKLHPLLRISVDVEVLQSPNLFVLIMGIIAKFSVFEMKADSLPTCILHSEIITFVFYG